MEKMSTIVESTENNDYSSNSFNETVMVKGNMTGIETAHEPLLKTNDSLNFDFSNDKLAYFDNGQEFIPMTSGVLSAEMMFSLTIGDKFSVNGRLAFSRSSEPIKVNVNEKERTIIKYTLSNEYAPSNSEIGFAFNPIGFYLISEPNLNDELDYVCFFYDRQHMLWFSTYDGFEFVTMSQSIVDELELIEFPIISTSQVTNISPNGLLSSNLQTVKSIIKPDDHRSILSSLMLLGLFKTFSQIGVGSSYSPEFNIFLKGNFAYLLNVFQYVTNNTAIFIPGMLLNILQNVNNVVIFPAQKTKPHALKYIVSKNNKVKFISLNSCLVFNNNALKLCYDYIQSRQYSVPTYLSTQKSPVDSYIIWYSLVSNSNVNTTPTAPELPHRFLDLIANVSRKINGFKISTKTINHHDDIVPYSSFIAHELAGFNCFWYKCHGYDVIFENSSRAQPTPFSFGISSLDIISSFGLKEYEYKPNHQKPKNNSKYSRQLRGHFAFNSDSEDETDQSSNGQSNKKSSNNQKISKRTKKVSDHNSNNGFNSSDSESDSFSRKPCDFDHDHLNQQIMDLKNSKEFLNNEIDDLTRRQTDLNRQLNAAEKTLSEIQDLYKNSQKSNFLLTERNTSLTSYADGIIRKMTDENDALESKLVELNQKFTSERNELINTSGNLTNEVINLQSKNQELVTELTEAKSKNSELVINNRKQCEELSTKNDELINDLNDALSKINEHRKNILELNSKNDGLAIEKFAICGEFEQFYCQIERSFSLFTEEKSLIEKTNANSAKIFENTIDLLVLEKSNLKLENQQLLTKIEKNVDKNEKLVSHVKKLNKGSKILFNNTTAASNELSSLKKQMILVKQQLKDEEVKTINLQKIIIEKDEIIKKQPKVDDVLKISKALEPKTAAEFEEMAKAVNEMGRTIHDLNIVIRSHAEKDEQTRRKINMINDEKEALKQALCKAKAKNITINTSDIDTPLNDNKKQSDLTTGTKKVKNDIKLNDNKETVLPIIESEQQIQPIPVTPANAQIIPPSPEDPSLPTYAQLLSNANNTLNSSTKNPEKPKLIEPLKPTEKLVLPTGSGQIVPISDSKPSIPQNQTPKILPEFKLNLERFDNFSFKHILVFSKHQDEIKAICTQLLSSVMIDNEREKKLEKISKFNLRTNNSLQTGNSKLNEADFAPTGRKVIDFNFNSALSSEIGPFSNTKDFYAKLFSGQTTPNTTGPFCLYVSEERFYKIGLQFASQLSELDDFDFSYDKNINTHSDRIAFINCFFLYFYTKSTIECPLLISFENGKVAKYSFSNVANRRFFLNPMPSLISNMFCDSKAPLDFSEVNSNFQQSILPDEIINPEKNAVFTYHFDSEFFKRRNGNIYHKENMTDNVLKAFNSLVELLNTMLPEPSDDQFDSCSCMPFTNVDQKAGTVFGIPISLASVFLIENTDITRKLACFAYSYNKYFCEPTINLPTNAKKNMGYNFFPLKVVGYLLRNYTRYCDFTRAIAMNSFKLAAMGKKLSPQYRIELLPIIFDVYHGVEFRRADSDIYNKYSFLMLSTGDRALSNYYMFDSNVFTNLSSLTRPMYTLASSNEVSKIELTFDPILPAQWISIIDDTEKFLISTSIRPIDHRTTIARNSEYYKDISINLKMNISEINGVRFCAFNGAIKTGLDLSYTKTNNNINPVYRKKTIDTSNINSMVNEIVSSSSDSAKNDKKMVAKNIDILKEIDTITSKKIDAMSKKDALELKLTDRPKTGSKTGKQKTSSVKTKSNSKKSKMPESDDAIANKIAMSLMNQLTFSDSDASSNSGSDDVEFTYDSNDEDAETVDGADQECDNSTEGDSTECEDANADNSQSDEEDDSDGDKESECPLPSTSTTSTSFFNFLNTTSKSKNNNDNGKDDSKLLQKSNKLSIEKVNGANSISSQIDNEVDFEENLEVNNEIFKTIINKNASKKHVLASLPPKIHSKTQSGSLKKKAIMQDQSKFSGSSMSVDLTGKKTESSQKNLIADHFFGGSSKLIKSKTSTASLNVKNDAELKINEILRNKNNNNKKMVNGNTLNTQSNQITTSDKVSLLSAIKRQDSIPAFDLSERVSSKSLSGRRKRTD